MGREEGETEAEVERRWGRHRRGVRPERTSGGQDAMDVCDGEPLFRFQFATPRSSFATARLDGWTGQISPPQTVECQFPPLQHRRLLGMITCVCGCVGIPELYHFVYGTFRPCSVRLSGFILHYQSS